MILERKGKFLTSIHTSKPSLTAQASDSKYKGSGTLLSRVIASRQFDIFYIPISHSVRVVQRNIMILM